LSLTLEAPPETDMAADHLESEPENMGVSQPSLFSEDELAASIPAEDRDAIEIVRQQFMGFRCSKKMAPQSKSWSPELKQQALQAIGGGDTDSVAMSDKLFSKDVECVKAMNEALAAVDYIKTDRKYTLPHPQPGVRLVRKGQEAELREKIRAAASDITGAAVQMNAERRIIQSAMRAKLGARYPQYAAVYEMDFTKLYVVTFQFVNTEVPSYLKHNDELYKEAMQHALLEAREVVEITKQEMVKNVIDAVDHMVERLESRRLLDGAHEVLDVRKKGKIYSVTFRQKVDGKLQPEETVELQQREFEVRVAEDTRRKIFTDATAGKLFDELEHIEMQMTQNRIGTPEMRATFDKLRKVIRGYDRNTLPASLRASGELRQEMVTNLGRVGESLLKLQVVKGSRDIVRHRAKSRTLNSDRV
jgi:hypothetical protein